MLHSISSAVSMTYIIFKAVEQRSPHALLYHVYILLLNMLSLLGLDQEVTVTHTLAAEANTESSMQTNNL